MPNVAEHLQQYNKNIQVIAELERLDRPPLDWIVTIVFYAALHLIEKKMAEFGQDFRTHGRRNAFVATNRIFASIAVEYDALYTDSLNSRYDCIEITEGKVNVAKQNLRAIERHCL